MTNLTASSPMLWVCPDLYLKKLHRWRAFRVSMVSCMELRVPVPGNIRAYLPGTVRFGQEFIIGIAVHLQAA
jgi:hypothetical protein